MKSQEGSGEEEARGFSAAFMINTGDSNDEDYNPDIESGDEIK